VSNLIGKKLNVKIIRSTYFALEGELWKIN
jgi:hypothetical protein